MFGLKKFISDKLVMMEARITRRLMMMEENRMTDTATLTEEFQEAWTGLQSAVTAETEKLDELTDQLAEATKTIAAGNPGVDTSGLETILGQIKAKTAEINAHLEPESPAAAPVVAAAAPTTDDAAPAAVDPDPDAPQPGE